MARLAGVDIPDNKRVEVALRRIYELDRLWRLRLSNRRG